MADNYHLIEGPFGNFTIHRVRPDDEKVVEKVLKHVKDHYLHDEPLSKLLGYSEQYGEEFTHALRYFLPHNMTFWVEENQTGEVAAVCVVGIQTYDYDAWQYFPKETQASEVSFKVGDYLHTAVDLYEMYNVTKCADLIVSSCAPKYRQRGLSKELYRRSVAFLAAEGIKLVKSELTSPFSRSAVMKLGFEEICRINYKDIKDAHGNPLFDASKLNEEHYAALMAKKLIFN